MKRFVISMLVFAPLMAFAADKTQKYEIAVDGMHCASCVDNLTKQLDSMTEIEKGSVKVNLKGKTASLTIKNGGNDAMALEKLKTSLNQKLDAAGFTITNVKVVN